MKCANLAHPLAKLGYSRALKVVSFSKTKKVTVRQTLTLLASVSFCNISKTMYKMDLSEQLLHKTVYQKECSNKTDL